MLGLLLARTTRDRSTGTNARIWEGPTFACSGAVNRIGQLGVVRRLPATLGLSVGRDQDNKAAVRLVE